MSLRIMQHGHEVVAWDRNEESVKGVTSEGAQGVSSLEDLIHALEPPRHVWLMLPSGDPTEATIRQQLVRSGYLKGIIGLPANLFYGTGIPACIVVLDKENATARKGIGRRTWPKGRLLPARLANISCRIF